ncbi:MAG: ubiquitin-conjugating enzyme E2 [Pirellulaceae bacterium]
MRESPRLRRLRSDLRAIEQLHADSTILEFTPNQPRGGGPPDAYAIRFNGRGFWRPDGSREVVTRDRHEMTIQLGASYPRMMPELAWRSQIFHPNISASGVVCLGGYGTHWVPSVNLDELCHMLWDMIRYQNFDVDSPYNREAAAWAKTQTRFQLPIDPRPLRDRVAAGMKPASGLPNSSSSGDAEVSFIEPEIVDAEVIEVREVTMQSSVGVSGEDQDIFFIE